MPPRSALGPRCVAFCSHTAPSGILSPISSHPNHRKRLHRRENSHDVRFITFSCEHRFPLFSNGAIADIFVESLVHARRTHGFELFAWVVMPEHVHLLVRAGRTPLDRSLLSMKLSVSKRVIPRWKELNAPILARISTPQGAPRFWLKGGGFDRNERADRDITKHIRYIHRNPVERGLVITPESWKWSSVRWWMGVREHEVECDPPPDPTYAWHMWTGYM